MNVPSWMSDITDQHNLFNVTLTSARSMWWCLTWNEVEFCIDICYVEPLFIDMYIVIYCVKILIPRIREVLSEL